MTAGLVPPPPSSYVGGGASTRVPLPLCAPSSGPDGRVAPGAWRTQSPTPPTPEVCGRRWLERCVTVALCTGKLPSAARVISSGRHPLLLGPLSPAVLDPVTISHTMVRRGRSGFNPAQKYKNKRKRSKQRNKNK